MKSHLTFGSPMGVHCQLTIEQGAIPGSARAYRRNLQELAARADVQKELKDHTDDAFSDGRLPTVPPTMFLLPQPRDSERDQ